MKILVVRFEYTIITIQIVRLCNKYEDKCSNSTQIKLICTLLELY